MRHSVVQNENSADIISNWSNLKIGIVRSKSISNQISKIEWLQKGIWKSNTVDRTEKWDTFIDDSQPRIESCSSEGRRSPADGHTFGNTYFDFEKSSLSNLYGTGRNSDLSPLFVSQVLEKTNNTCCSLLFPIWK